MSAAPSRIRTAGVLFALLLLPFLLHGLAALLQPQTGYLKWDNFEYYAPQIAEAHGQLLDGRFPHWNPWVLLGDPLHARGQAGALYPPYTLALLLARASGAGDGRLPALIFFLHLPLATAGGYLLARALAVGRIWALVTALSVGSGGFVVMMSSLWIVTAPLAALTPWMLWGLVKLIDRPDQRRWRVVAPVVLALVLYPGHVQFALYLWLLAALFALGFALWVRRRPDALPRLLVGALAALLLTAPVIAPLYALYQQSDRAAALGVAPFLERSLDPSALAGLLLPTLQVPNGFFAAPGGVALHLGAWLVPALAVGLLTLLRRGRVVVGTAPIDTAEGRRLLVLLIGLATLFTLLALGSHTPLLPATYGVPVWSALRWPFKFLYVALPLLVLAGGVAAEFATRRARPRSWAIAALGTLVAALAAHWIWGTGAGLDRAAAGVALALIVATAWGSSRGGRITVAALLAIEAVLWIAAAHDSRGLGLKSYAERYGAVTAETLGIDPRWRVLPVSPPLPDAPQMQPLGLLHAPVIGRYLGVTGTVAPLTPQRYLDYLPADVHGLIPRELLRPLLESHLLRTIAGRYVIVGHHDRGALGYLERSPDYELVRRLETSSVYANRDALPLAWFADAIEPFSDPALRLGLIGNRRPLRSAFVEGLGPRSGLARGEVEGLSWQPDRIGLTATLERPGFLVIASGFDPAWRAWVDGVEVPLYRVNGLVVGIELGSGRHEIRLGYDGRLLWIGAAVALATLVLLLLLARRGGLSRSTAATAAARRSPARR